MMSKGLIGSIIQMLHASSPAVDDVEHVTRCLRCGLQMHLVGSGVGCLGVFASYVVPPILVRECPHCGYSARSWA
jgi:Zn ribbon nucleic-acid-binding protein